MILLLDIFTQIKRSNEFIYIIENYEKKDYNGIERQYKKIDFTKMEKISKLVFFTAWKLVNQTERIKVDSSKK